MMSPAQPGPATCHTSACYFLHKVCTDALGIVDPRSVLDEALIVYLVSMLLENEATEQECMCALEAYLGLADGIGISAERLRDMRLELRALHAQEEETERRTAQRRAAAASTGPAVDDGQVGMQEIEGVEGGAADEDPQEEAAGMATDLSFLESLVPAVPSDIVSFVYIVVCCGSRDAAAEQLVAGASEEGVQAWRLKKNKHEAESRAREDRAAEAARRVKDAICRRFDMQVVEVGEGPASGHRKGSSRVSESSSSRPDALLVAAADKAAAQNKDRVLYRDGVPVRVTGGARYIVESTTPEWDGGSRGKVKTKGKRGKGWA